jgi:hypothetical protein
MLMLEPGGPQHRFPDRDKCREVLDGTAGETASTASYGRWNVPCGRATCA